MKLKLMTKQQKAINNEILRKELKELHNKGIKYSYFEGKIDCSYGSFRNFLCDRGDLGLFNLYLLKQILAEEFQVDVKYI